MTSPLSPEAVAQMVADREAGTPGPWVAAPSPFEVYNIGHGVLKNHIVADDYTMIAALYDDDLDCADARRIARLPDLEAAYLTLAAENATLRAERDKWVKIDVARDATFTGLQDRYDALRASEAAALERVDAITPLASVLVQFVTALADECDADLGDVVMSVRVMPEGREVAEVSATDIIAKVRALTPTADKE